MPSVATTMAQAWDDLNAAVHLPSVSRRSEESEEFRATQHMLGMMAELVARLEARVVQLEKR